MTEQLKFFPELGRYVSRYDGDDMEDSSRRWTFYGIFKDEQGEEFEIWITDHDERWDIVA